MERRRAWALVAPIVLGGCGGSSQEDRQPSAAEVNAYTAAIDRKEAEAKAKAIRESRAKEEVLDRQHRAQVPAPN